MEKQIYIFREEALKLFNKVEEKESIIHNLKLQLN